MSFSPVAWRAADACFAELLAHPESTWPDRVRALDISAEVRACLEQLIIATGRDGLLDRTISLDARHPELAVGQLEGQVLGSWRLGQEIGRGGMAVVYEAQREGVDYEQIAAIKLLPRGSAGQDQFRREQRLLAQLEHAFIARFLDAGVDVDGTPWIAMERVVGAPLEQVTEGWDAAAVVALMRRVIEAVAFAHRHLIIHRDLKPGNVLVDESGRPRLLDFGIAKLLSSDAAAHATRVLTPEYAAPEQFSGKAVSTATDVYGLGAILHRLLTGSPPRGHSGQDAIQLGAIDDADLRAIVEKALRDDPARRYETAEALSSDLGRWQRKEPVLARPDSRRYRFGRWLVRHRNAAIAGLLVLVALLLGGAGVVWQSHQTAVQARMVSAQNKVLRGLLMAPHRTARGRQVSMADVLDDAMAIVDEHMPEPSRQRALLTSSLGETQSNLGRPESAVALWRRAEADLEQVAPDDHRQLIQARLNIADNLIDAGDPEAAQALLNEIHSAAAEQLPADDETHATLAIQRYRAASARGGLSPSDPLVRDVLDVGSRVRWRRDDVQEAFRCGRLNLLINTGQYEAAADEAQALLAWTSSVWGAESGRRLCAYEGAITALALGGRLEEAEAMANRAVALVADWLGDSDRVTFSLRHSQANIVQELGRNDEAIALHRAQIERLDQVEGLTTVDRKLPFQGLAVALHEAARYSEAEPIQRRILASFAEDGLAASPHALIMQSNLALVLLFDGRPEAARREIEAALERLQSTLGADHAITVFARSIRGGVRIALGDHEGALADLALAPDQLKAAFGEDDVNVMNSRFWLAQTLSALERDAEALPLVQSAYDWHRGHKGAEHPRTLAIRALFEELSSVSR
jgi:serine/threonine-protein kinase